MLKKIFINFLFIFITNSAIAKEIKIISDFCKKLNVEVSECTHWANGGKGTKDLAKKVVETCKKSKKK